MHTFIFIVHHLLGLLLSICALVEREVGIAMEKKLNDLRAQIKTMWRAFAVRVLCPVEMVGALWGNKSTAFGL